MSTRILKREELIRRITGWRDGKISSHDLHRWAEDRYPLHSDMDYEDWEDDTDSVSNVVLNDLDKLDMNLRLPEDAQIYLEFLATPRGAFADGYTKFQQHLDDIDMVARRMRLQNDPLYGKFCKK